VIDELKQARSDGSINVSKVSYDWVAHLAPSQVSRAEVHADVIAALKSGELERIERNNDS
jgi:hypothetical protein